MSTENQPPESRNDAKALRAQCSEDPRRDPHEKETGLHAAGDDTRFFISSFKRVIYEKLLKHPDFSLTRLHVVDNDGQERTVDSLDEVTPSLTITGVAGHVPVGAVTIGTPRTSNSHAEIVK